MVLVLMFAISRLPLIIQNNVLAPSLTLVVISEPALLDKSLHHYYRPGSLPPHRFIISPPCPLIILAPSGLGIVQLVGRKEIYRTTVCQYIMVSLGGRWTYGSS